MKKATRSKAKAKAKSKSKSKSRPGTGKKAAAATKKKKPAASAKKKAAPAAAPRKFGPRADLGAPVEEFFARQPPHLGSIVDHLRTLIDEAAPDAASSLKWGMPFYTLGGNTVCAVAAFKAHVNLILPGPDGTYPDPEGRLEGDSENGQHLKLRSLNELPYASVRDWLRTAAARARAG